ncbi:MAG: hypothetical protein KDD47_17430 [Acidobacteria bacterium]|nr:hypothetical protein [Acidobacteriota bacterium]
MGKEGLLEIHGCGEKERKMDVVFVHGLGGDREGTWHPAGRPQDLFPRWIGEDHPEVGVWSLGYGARTSDWFGASMPLADRAVNALEHLRAHGLVRRPLVFVTHSLGGIVVKRMLRHARDMNAGDLEEVRGVAFLATPHGGSSLATFARLLPRIFRPSSLVYELVAAHPELRDLSSWYRNNHQRLGIRTKVLFETQKTWWLKVVREDAADPGVAGVDVVPIPADHFSICKPCSRDELVYRTVSAFVAECLAGKGPAGEGPRQDHGGGSHRISQEPSRRDSAAAVPAGSAKGPALAAPPRGKGALGIWQERLEFFLEEEAKAADAAQKFTLRKQIEECREKIRELGGER